MFPVRASIAFCYPKCSLLVASPLKPQRTEVVILRKRKQAILIRLTDNEKNYLQRQADNAGLKMEPFIRKLIMGIEILPRPPDNIAQLIREINAVGNNINQIARKVNTENSVNQAQLEEILHLLGEIYREVKN